MANNGWETFLSYEDPEQGRARMHTYVLSRMSVKFTIWPWYFPSPFFLCLYVHIYSCRYLGGVTEVEEVFWGDIQTRAEGWGVGGEGTACLWQCSSCQCKRSLQVPASSVSVFLSVTHCTFIHHTIMCMCIYT